MNTSLQLTEMAMSHLNQTRKWANFLAIIGFISCGFLVLLAFFLGSIMSFLPNYDNVTSASFGAVGSGIFTFIYLILAGICFLIYLYLYRFAKKLKIAINSNDNAQLEESFKNLKLYYRINGIIIIVVFGIYVLAALFGIFAALAIS